MKQFLTLSTTLKARLISDMLITIAYVAVMPFMALYLAEHVNAVFAGVFLTCTVVLNFLASFIGGYMADYMPRRKLLNILYAIDVCAILGMVITVNMYSLGLAIFCTCFMIFEVSTAMGEPGREAIIMDAIYESVRTYVYRFEYWMVNISMALGMLLGAALYLQFKRTLFIVLLLTLVIAWYLFNRYIRFEQVLRQKESMTSVVSNFVRSYFTVIKDYRFVKLSIGQSLFQLGEMIMATYIVIRLQESFNPFELLGIEINGVRVYTLLMIINTVIVVCFTFTVNRMVDYLPKKYAFLFGGAIYTVGYTIITGSSTLWLLIMMCILATLGELLITPVIHEQRFLLIPEDKRGTYSTFSSLTYLGGDLLSKFSIVLGAVLVPWMMSIYVMVLLSLGILMLYSAIFRNRQNA